MGWREALRDGARSVAKPREILASGLSICGFPEPRIRGSDKHSMLVVEVRF